MLLGYFPESRVWLVENICDGRPNILGLRNNLILRINQLQRYYQRIQAQDLVWIKYLNGLEAGDFLDREVQDRQVSRYEGHAYPDIVRQAMDLENRLQFRMWAIDSLRQAPLGVVPPVNPPIQQIPPRRSLNSDGTRNSDISQSQERQDGSAKAVPSTSGFLTGNGGSLNQADPSAAQKVGTDQFRDQF